MLFLSGENVMSRNSNLTDVPTPAALNVPVPAQLPSQSSVFPLLAIILRIANEGLSNT
jgi:hypothetical protein